MEDLDAPRKPASFAGKAIASAADRLLAYRALAAHLRQGVGLAEAIALLTEEVSIDEDDKIDADFLARSRLLAALNSVSAAFSEAGSDKPIARVMSKAGIMLTIEERAVFALPGSITKDLAGLFETAAVALTARKP